jgi:hypothetical protein
MLGLYNVNLLTYSMEQSPSWEADWSAASQEIPCILWNPKVHHHKCTPTVPILSWLHPVHTPTSHFPKIHSNIILPSMPGSPQWSHSLRFPHQNPVHTSPLPHMCYMPLPSHFIWLVLVTFLSPPADWCSGRVTYLWSGGVPFKFYMLCR